MLSGRKMVLNPTPWNVPAKADSGPRLGTDETRSLNVVRLYTSPNLKLLGNEKAGWSWISRMVPPIGPSDRPASP